MRTCLPLKGYVHYFQVNHALRNFNFCDVTYFLAKQTLCNRSIDGNLSFLQIGFTFGNDSINHLHAILHVLKLYLIENLYRIGFQLRLINNLSVGQWSSGFGKNGKRTSW